MEEVCDPSELELEGEEVGKGRARFDAICWEIDCDPRVVFEEETCFEVGQGRDDED